MLSVRVLRSWARFALALFVANSVLPRASMYAHHHDGGDHVHVHPWGEDAVVEHDHDDDHDAHHHFHDADGGPGVEDPDGDHGTHVHSQPPFQHATPADVPRLVDVVTIRSFDVPLHLAAGVELRRAASARAPPSPGTV